MSEIRVRKLEEHVVSALRARAKRHGRSLEAELRILLSEEAMRPRREMAARLRKLHEAMRLENGGKLLSDSAISIREDRDRRG